MKKILIIMLITINFLYANEKEEKNNNQVKQQNISATSQTKPIKKSSIPKEHANFLIQLFDKEPQVAASIKFSYLNAAKILKTFQNNKQKNISPETFERYKKMILDPVRYSFPILHAPVLNFLMEPLIIKGTINESIINNIKNKKAQNKNKNIKKNLEVTIHDIVQIVPQEKLPFTCKFLLASEKEAEKFFYKELKTMDNLIQGCKEFLKIFGEIKDIFTPEINTKANSLIRKMLQKIKNKKNEQTTTDTSTNKG